MGVTPGDFGRYATGDDGWSDGHHYQIVTVYLTPTYWTTSFSSTCTQRDKHRQDAQLENTDAGVKTITFEFYLTEQQPESANAEGNVHSHTIALPGSGIAWGIEALPVDPEADGQFHKLGIFSDEIETLPQVSVEEMRITDVQTTGTEWIWARQSRPNESTEHDQAYSGGYDNYVEVCGRYNLATDLWAGRRPASSWLVSRVFADTINCLGYFGLNGMATTVILNRSSPT